MAGQEPPRHGSLPGSSESQSIMHCNVPSEPSDGSGREQVDITTMLPAPTLSRSASTSSQRSHNRSYSLADPGRKNKRLTMTLPIQSAAISQSRVPPSPTKSIISTTTVAPDLASPTGPSDSNFLTALAAQERRVLELKEELSRAEQDLLKLKREWATHEAQKKRHDAKKVQKMRPLSAVLPSPTSQESEENTSARISQEMERRRALLNGLKPSNRTVFSGSRHTRTLSLLTPAGPGAHRAPEAHLEPISAHTETTLTRPPLPYRASTNPDLTKVVVETEENIDLTLPKDVLIKTGRQMASDFKDGLWTFIEDLRQATVGEEGVDGVPNRRSHQDLPSTGLQRSTKDGQKKNNASSSQRTHTANRQPGGKPTTARPTKPARSSVRRESMEDAKLIDVGSSFWKENGLGEPTSAETPIVRKHSKKVQTSRRPASSANQEVVESIESWDMWDSPVEKRQGRVALDVQSMTGSGQGSPKQRKSSFGNDHLSGADHDQEEGQQSIPWPALTKLAPSNLRRTASHLMSEWEKSLTPPPEEHRGRVDYVGSSAAKVD